MSETTEQSEINKDTPVTDAVAEELAKTSVKGKDWADSDDDDVQNYSKDNDLDQANNVPMTGGIDPNDLQAQVKVLQADPSTPYYSVSTFEELGLSENLLKGIYGMKFQKPSKIQATSLPMIINTDPSKKIQNLIGQGHNGSGKTACFTLGMLSRIDDQQNYVQALCVVPTRELARQIKEVIESLGKYTKVSVYLAVKQSLEEKEKNSSDKTGKITDQIIVGTPGRVMDIIKHRSFDPKKVAIFVLDEADVMVDTQGMGDQTIRIKRALSPDVQTLLFSATYADEVRELAVKLAPNANQITIEREKLSLDTVKQYYFKCANAVNRFEVLSEIYAFLTIGQSIIFVRTRNDASQLANQMRAEGHTVSLLYGGDMTPEERDRVIDEFRGGTTKVLITTNVLARGVDVLQVTVVINYDIPTDAQGQADPETYLHRVGRTGRFGRKGVAINFVYDGKSRQLLKDIEDYYGHPAVEVTDVEDLEERIRRL